MGNLPDIFEREELHKYLSSTLVEAGGAIEPGDPIVQVQL